MGISGSDTDEGNSEVSEGSQEGLGVSRLSEVFSEGEKGEVPAWENFRFSSTVEGLFSASVLLLPFGK